jgi:hypothetical protein
VKADAIRSIGLAAAAAIVLATGVWLTSSGRPYGSLLVNVHKLVDLGAVIAIGVIAYQANKAAPFSAMEWAALALTAVLVVAAFATGGVVTGMPSAPSAALWAHRIGSWLAAAMAAVSAWLLIVR